MLFAFVFFIIRISLWPVKLNTALRNLFLYLTANLVMTSLYSFIIFKTSASCRENWKRKLSRLQIHFNVRDGQQALSEKKSSCQTVYAAQ